MFGSKKMIGDVVERPMTENNDENDASVANSGNAPAKSVSGNAEAENFCLTLPAYLAGPLLLILVITMKSNIKLFCRVGAHIRTCESF